MFKRNLVSYLTRLLLKIKINGSLPYLQRPARAIPTLNRHPVLATTALRCPGRLERGAYGAFAKESINGGIEE